MQTVPFPAKCTDEQLKEILKQAEDGLPDYPYSVIERRYLAAIDYHEERLRREQKEVEEEVSPEQELLVRFMDKLCELNSEFQDSLQTAINSCKNSQKPTELLGLRNMHVNMGFMAHASVRTAIRQLTGHVIIAPDPSHIWLIPSAVDVEGWVRKNDGFTSPERIGNLYPYGSVFLECLAKSARERREKYIVDTIESPANLQEVINILAVYPHYYALEEFHRAVFAFGFGNKVLARPLYPRPDAYLHFISPEAQLEAWDSMS